MLDTPGGPRALAVAARSLLLNNPILQHPGAPCHTLLTQLSGLTQQTNPGLPSRASAAASPAAPRSDLAALSEMAARADMRDAASRASRAAALERGTRLQALSELGRTPPGEQGLPWQPTEGRSSEPQAESGPRLHDAPASMQDDAGQAKRRAA
eukprot:1280224-Prymnesium_polylepis.1